MIINNTNIYDNYQVIDNQTNLVFINKTIIPINDVFRGSVSFTSPTAAISFTKNRSIISYN